MSEFASVQPRPYRIHNQIQHYAWGTRGASALIPQLLGIPPDPDTPYAELWMGAHPKAPSLVELPDASRISLDTWIANHPEETLGASVARQFGKLPFLFKVLTAEEALSIQAHPNKAQARVLHDCDPEHYPDDNHKPEIAVALDRLSALVGFRPLPELTEVLRQYPPLADFAGPQAVDAVLIAQTPTPAEAQALVHALFSAIVQRSIDEPKALEATIQRLVARFATRKYVIEREIRFLRLYEHYGSRDVGLLASLLLNLVDLAPGEAIFTGAGVPHAYLEGNILECMANSDNVIRVGLTPKFKDAEALLEIVVTTPGTPDILDGNPTILPGGAVQAIYTSPAPEFQLQRWQLGAGVTHVVDKGAIPAILLVLKGEIEIAWDESTDGIATYRRGESAFLPACLTNYRLHAEGEAEIVQASVPDK